MNQGSTGSWSGAASNKKISPSSWGHKSKNKASWESLLHNYVCVHRLHYSHTTDLLEGPQSILSSHFIPFFPIPSSPTLLTGTHAQSSLSRCSTHTSSDMSKLALGTRAASTALRALEFAISALILGIFSYYLSGRHLAH